MSLIKSIDSKLMHLLTLNLRYPDWSKAPLSFALLIVTINTLLAALFIIPMLISGKVGIVSLMFGILLLLSAFYHWRLWRRLKSERS